MQPANTNIAMAAEQPESTDSTASVPFYQRGSLESLLSPVSEEEFRARYWEKKPLIVHRENPNYYGDLFSLQDFDDYLNLGQGYVKTAEATGKKSSRHEGTGPQAMEKVLSDMQAGHTLILDNMQAYHPRLGRLCRMLGQETGDYYQTNLYLTPAKGKGFTPHWDNHDVFILQVMGSKHWKVEKTRRTLPLKFSGIEEEGRELRGEVYEFTLRQGDTVYIPRGFVHAAECGAENSLHVTLGIHPHTWDELLIAALKAAAMADENLRLCLPAGYMQGDGAGIVRRAGEIFRNIADPDFLAGVLNQYRDEIVQRSALDISGQVESFFNNRALTLDDRMKVRPGMVYILRDGTDTVTLKVGTRSITFPDFFADALRHALQQAFFRIRDLPGDLEDEEKLVFVERLIQEALITRA